MNTPTAQRLLRFSIYASPKATEFYTGRLDLAATWGFGLGSPAGIATQASSRPNQQHKGCNHEAYHRPTVRSGVHFIETIKSDPAVSLGLGSLTPELFNDSPAP